MNHHALAGLGVPAGFGAAGMSLPGRLVGEIAEDVNAVEQLSLEPGADVESLLGNPSRGVILDLLLELNDATAQLELFGQEFAVFCL